jgi:Glycosyl hydrolase family 12
MAWGNMRIRPAVVIASAVVTCAVAGCAAAGTGTGGTAAGQRAAAASAARKAAAVDAARAQPVMVAPPQTAVMPAAPAAAKHSAEPSGHATPAHSQPASAPPATTPTAGGSGSAACSNPSYTTSSPTAMWNLSPYFVANDMWNINGYSVTQTQYACSYSDWYVVATMNNDSGDGAVKTYPNSHRDFDNAPAVSSLHSVTSTFAESSPDTGIYEDAYDIWFDNYSIELMVWTYNHGQTPGGSEQGSVTLGGQTYQVWQSGSGNSLYVALVADQSMTSGTVDLLSMFQWLVSKGWLSSSATLTQVGYGVELVSTDNAPEKFDFSNFSVSAS